MCAGMGGERWVPCSGKDLLFSPSKVTSGEGEARLKPGGRAASFHYGINGQDEGGISASPFN